MGFPKMYNERRLNDLLCYVIIDYLGPTEIAADAALFPTDQVYRRRNFTFILCFIFGFAAKLKSHNG